MHPNSQTPIISTILLNWNRADLLEKTLESYLSTIQTPFELFIIDNASTDTSRDVINRVTEQYPNVSAIFLPENQGGKAFNVALPLCRGRFIHFSENDLEYLPGWDEYVLQAFEDFPKLGQLSLFAPVPTDEEVWELKPASLKHQNGTIIYEAHQNVGTSSVIRAELVARGLRFDNIVGDNGVLFPNDGKFSYDIKQQGYLVAWSHHYLVNNLGHYGEEIENRLNYYRETYDGKNWLKVEKLQRRFEVWKQKPRPQRRSVLFPDDPVLPEKSEPTSECPEPQLWSMFDGWTAEVETVEFLYSLVRLVKPRYVVETGTWHGFTATAIGQALKRNGRGRLVSLEIDADSVAVARKRVQHHGVADVVTVLEQSSLTFTPEEPIDFLLLDSALEIREKEFRHFQPHLKPGAVVVFHDTSARHKVVREQIQQHLHTGVLTGFLLQTPRGIAIFQYQGVQETYQNVPGTPTLEFQGQKKTVSTNRTTANLPVCVAGMHRSGTSLLTHMLHKAGMYLGKPEEMMPAAPDNPDGFWENLRFVHINDTLLAWAGGSWDNPVILSPETLSQHPQWQGLQEYVQNLLRDFQQHPRWGWKDPRNSLTLPVWQTILPEFQVIVPFRNPLAVAASLQKRNGFPLEKGMQLWYFYNQAVLNQVGDTALWVPYEMLVQHPKAVFTELLKRLHWELAPNQLEEAVQVVKPALNHNGSDPAEVLQMDSIPSQVKELYQTLLQKSPFSFDQPDTQVPVSQTVEPRAADPVQALMKIQQRVENGEEDSAAEELDQLVRQLPDDFPQWNEVGVLYFRLNRMNQAMEAFRKAYTNDPTNISAAKNLADIMAQLGELDSAARLYHQVFRTHPEDEDTLIFAGKLAYHLHEEETARQLFTQVLERNPENAIARENLEYLAQHPRTETPVQPTDAITAFVQEVAEQMGTSPVAETSEAPTAAPEPAASPNVQQGCPACGSMATARARYIADIVTCVDCGLTYLRTVPDQSTLKVTYDMYADEFSHMRLPENEEEAKASPLRREYFLNEIQQFVKTPGNMLDVGCGWGAFLMAARERGFKPQGIEVTPRAAAFARQTLGIPVDTKPLEEQEYPEKTFTLVTMNHVLEHLPNTSETLKTVYRILEPNGVFAGIVPNFASFCSEMEGERWSWLDPNFHYVHFTPETLRRVLEEAGFVVEKLYTAKGDYDTERLKFCLLQKYGELSAEEYEQKIRELEEAGKGEEIRFIARKPEQPRSAKAQQTGKGKRSRKSQQKQGKKEPAAPAVATAQKKRSGRKQFSIIIPVYNQVEYTRVCLQKIYENTAPDIRFEVIVVDNASTDDTPRFLEEAQNTYPNLKVIRSETNLKYAGGCNLGARHAKGTYLVFLNNDTEPQPGWLENALRTFKEEKDAGILGAKLLYPDRTVQHCGIEFQNSKINNNFIWPFHRYRHAREDNPLVNQREDVHAVTGACLFIPRKLFHQVQGFDESYGMYFEDTDLCFKVRESGKRIVYEPEIVVIHHEGKSTENLEEIHALNEKAAKIFYQKWENVLVDIALDVLMEKQDGKYYYFSEFFFPGKVTPENMNFLAKLLYRLGDFYAYTGGIGDALLFLSTFYDREKNPTVVCAPNSVGAARALFNNFERLQKVYFLPFPPDGLWHLALRGIWSKLPNCKGMGVTPAGGYEEEWNSTLNIFERYGVTAHPQWVANLPKEKVVNYQVVLQPKGSIRGMVGSKRNIIRPREWLKLQKFLIENGITPVIIGTPDEGDYYPLLEGVINRRSYNLSEQMRLINGADVFIGADSWGKTLAALNGIPTFVFRPAMGKDLQGWTDPSEYVFIRPWESITLVENFEHFSHAFEGVYPGTLTHDLDYREYHFRSDQKPAPYFQAVVSTNQAYIRRMSGMGDVVMTFPIARLLKKKFPGTEVNLTTAWAYKHLVDANPDIDRFIPPDVFDAYLIFEPRAVVLDAARYGYASWHQIDAYLSRFELEGAPEEKEIRIQVPDVAREQVSRILEDVRRQYRKSGASEWHKMVLLHPAKGDPNRTWPKERWEELARLLTASGNLVITVGSDTASVNRGVHTLDVGNVVHLENRLSPMEFVALCQEADVLVSTDSGPIQLAAATDIAIVGIYSVVRGEHRLPYRHGKAGWNAVAVEPACPFKGCYEKMNDEIFMKPYWEQIQQGKLAPAEMFSSWCIHHDKFACMRHMITVDQVWEALQPFLFDSMDAEQILQTVEKLVSASDYVAAQKELEKWIRREDVDPRILKRYVELLKERGEWVQYVEWLERYVRRNPDDAVAVNELGVVRWQQNRKNEALNLFRSAVNLNGNHPDHVKNLADALLTEEQFDAAIQLYIYLIQKYPQDPEPYERLATLYIENGNYDDARLLLDRALQHNPNDTYLQTWRKLLEIPKLYLGYHFINQGELEIARQLLEEVLTEYPDNVDALSGLGSILFHQGEMEAARKVYNRILQLSPDHPESLFYLYKIALKEGNFAALDELQQQFAAVFQRHPSLRKVVVERLLEEERFEEALVALDRYLGDFPEDADGYVILGNLFYEGGKVQEARRFYHRALELEPENDELRQLLENLPGLDFE